MLLPQSAPHAFCRMGCVRVCVGTCSALQLFKINHVCVMRALLESAGLYCDIILTFCARVLNNHTHSPRCVNRALTPAPSERHTTRSRHSRGHLAAFRVYVCARARLRNVCPFRFFGRVLNLFTRYFTLSSVAQATFRSEGTATTNDDRVSVRNSFGRCYASK